MSRVKISENLFLEKNELQRIQKFSGEDGWQRAMRSLVKKYGIVQNEDKTSFAVVVSSSANSVDVLPGLAYNSNMEAIVMEQRVTLALGAAVTGQDKWIVLRRAVTNNERGTVSVQSDGSLIGVGTEFTKVLRGQPNFPTKVRFTSSSQNIYEYEVVSVVSDTSAILSGNFVAEGGMKYSVVGTFTPGFIPSSADKEIYEYDYFNLEIVNSATKPEVTNDEFVLACIKYGVGGAWNIVDLRGDCAFSVDSQSGSGSSSDSGSNGLNPLVSLLGVRRVGGTAWREKFARIELLVEYAYKITSFDYVSTGSGYTLTISNGSCNALTVVPSAIPDGLFNGFIVLNRENMRSVKIASQTANVLTIENDENASQLLSDSPDLIVVPDFTHMEVMISAGSNAVMPQIPFTKESGSADGRLRMIIDLEYPDAENPVDTVLDTVELRLKYRMFSSAGYRGYPFNFNTASYHDYIDGADKIAGNGVAYVSLGDIVPEEEPKNYS